MHDVPGFHYNVDDRFSDSSTAPPCSLSPNIIRSVTSTVDCDAAQSCRLRNVLFSGTEHESTFYTFGDPGDRIACFTEPISTAVHRRFVRYMGKRTKDMMADLSMAEASKDARALLSRIAATGGWCDDRAIFAFNIPKPSYYYHAIAEGAIPLAHAIAARIDKDPSFIPTLLPLQPFRFGRCQFTLALSAPYLITQSIHAAEQGAAFNDA